MIKQNKKTFILIRNENLSFFAIVVVAAVVGFYCVSLCRGSSSQGTRTKAIDQRLVQTISLRIKMLLPWLELNIPQSFQGIAQHTHTHTQATCCVHLMRFSALFKYNANWNKKYRHRAYRICFTLWEPTYIWILFEYSDLKFTEKPPKCALNCYERNFEDSNDDDFPRILTPPSRIQLISASAISRHSIEASHRVRVVAKFGISEHEVWCT